MNSALANGIWFLLGYMAIFFAVVKGIFVVNARLRRSRRPLPENVRLLRMPGEFLWRQIMAEDQEEVFSWLGIMMVPLLVGWCAFHFALPAAHGAPLAWILFAAVMVAAVGFSAQLVVGLLKRRERWYLGFFGERYVAEYLDPLKAQGWFIFHDIQCPGAKGKFNLDHVAVGPGGVWVIETKTRSKGAARDGYHDYEVFSDGVRVEWPWGVEADSLKQAGQNAQWLHDCLKRMIGKAIPVSAVLALPGYMVTERKLGRVRVANPKNLPQVLTAREGLSAFDIDAIRRQLEDRCRDIDY